MSAQQKKRYAIWVRNMNRLGLNRVNSEVRIPFAKAPTSFCNRSLTSIPTRPRPCYRITMRNAFLPKASLILSIILTLTGCSITHVMRVENHEVIGVETMIGELRDSPLIFVGELHDVSSHHQLQLNIIKGLRVKVKPLAIGMEMFEDSGQRTLDAWSEGKITEEAFRMFFAWNWRNVPWAFYEDILVYARDNKIPIVALNLPRVIVQKVSRQGFSALSSDERRLLPPGVDAEVSDAYLDFFGLNYPVHGSSGEAFRRICETQMLRNRVMARRIGDYLALHPETTMVVLTGGGHARGNGGIPAELGDLSYRIVLPPVLGMTRKTVTENDADYLMEAPY